MLCKDAKLVPKFKIAKILKIKDEVYSLLSVYIGTVITNAESLNMIAGDLCEAFPTIYPEVIKRSLQQFFNVELTYDNAEKFAYKFGANFQDMVKDQPVMPFCGIGTGWEMVEILRSLPAKTGKGREATKITFRILTGRAAGETFTKVISQKQMNILARPLGFNQKGVCSFDGFRASFFKFRMAVLLCPDPRGEVFAGDVPVGITTYCPKRGNSYNRKLIKERFGAPCIVKLKIRCSQCPRGIDTCPRGCRLNTLVTKPCSRCGTEQALFDKDFCLNCNYIQLKKAGE